MARGEAQTVGQNPRLGSIAGLEARNLADFGAISVTGDSGLLSYHCPADTADGVPLPLFPFPQEAPVFRP
ncbi:hypothetical protein GCM10010215_25680 [Streptomyces virginiae]|uniref:Uncharacterized protein n=1 Tax=Streptomyces virginiae TaxID=1961 RepID=A0ABQ3NNA6_STRVG|nr:hypothetical protein GCM10010215_25680 [Streptomyces virginiae]GHI14253.1 hypothetical protein Scinn_37160 [Streptomyces virginiae]